MDAMPHSWTDIFQSTLSVRRATHGRRAGSIRVLLFQSTLSVRRATDKSTVFV